MNPHKRLELLLSKVMSPDRYALRKELKSLIKKSRKNKSADKDTSRLLKLEREINNSIQRKEWRRKNIPRFYFNPALPITDKKDEIIEAIKNNDILIISGETGSGKTTQLPKFCFAAGRGVNGIIGCTQPRRIAAVSIANRIAEELGEDVGKSVGYKIRFDEKTGETPFIKIMTDGILLAETQNDPFLNAYDTIIVDEAHERSINIDFILGILKKLLAKRRDLKLIITSATIDTDKFSKTFNNAPVIEVSGKMYPVEVLYRGITGGDTETNPDYTERAAEEAISLLKESGSGDILIFMPTEQDIRETCELLEKKNKDDFAVFPLYARLPASQQKQIFNPMSKRKIIVATNIAETSLTIPNITYVIDTGLARMSEYSPSSGIVSMPVKAISRSSADQRMGRCGRVRDGVCIRLYDKEDYEGRGQFTSPEIFRTNLAEVILKMTAFGLGDLSVFTFIDKPKQQAINDGYNTLVELGAIQRKDKYNITLTDRGGIMAALPIDPKLSRMLIEANERKCLQEVLVIASMLSVQDIRERPIGKEAEADEKHENFVHHSSDFLTLLNLWNKYSGLFNDNSSKNKIRKFCKENFLSYNRLKEIREIHAQLSIILEENGIVSKKNIRRIIKEFDSVYIAIHKSILTGFISNIANKKNNNLFAASKQREAMIFPGSGIFNKAKDWIVCAELVKTSQLFARIAANIKVEWLEELAGSQCEYSYRDPHWDRDKGDVYAYEHATLYGLEIVRNRRVAYGRKNPSDACKVFIREALVEDTFTEVGLDSTAYAGNASELYQLGRDFHFMRHNADLIKKFQNIQNRLRKKIIIGKDDLYMFYADHIRDAYNSKNLDILIKNNGSDDFLCLKDEDLLSSVPDYNKLRDYPETILIDNIKLELIYKFNPDYKDDGITVKIPVSELQCINLTLIESAIPGFYRERITELLRNLPKQYRRHFVPVADVVDQIIKEMPKGFPLTESLHKHIYDKYDINIPKSEFFAIKLPDHLQLKLSIIDKNGMEIKSGRNPEILIKELIKEYAAIAYKEAKRAWERDNISKWDFSDLPENINIENDDGLEFIFYPGLSAMDGKLNLRIFMNNNEALASHKTGIAEFTEREVSGQLNIIKNELSFPEELKSTIMLFGGLASIRDIYQKRIMRDSFYKNIRSKVDFDNNVKAIRESMWKLGSDISLLLIDVLENYKSAKEKFEILKSKNKTIKQNILFLNKLKDELNCLVPRDFLFIYDDHETASLGRYIRALAIRAERGCANLQKDIQKEKEILFFRKAFDDEYSTLPADASLEKRKALRTLFWLLEEYKVSVFAPELKTEIKISGKRLQNTIEEIRGIS